MRWTIGRKLGFGFATMIALIVAVAGIVYFKVQIVNKVQNQVIEDRQPTVLAATGVLNGINDSLAALRGYMILGKDKFKQGRTNAWKSLDENVATLTEISKGWSDPKDQELLDELKTVLGEFRVAQKTIEDICRHKDNRPDLKILLEDAAARAGEAGKGFAVVATEVKELARQTGSATDDIRGRIEGIQNSTQATVHSIAEISEAIKNVNEVSRTIASAVEEQSITTKEIAANIGQTATAADTVARGVAEAATVSKEISRNIVGVDQAATQAAAGAAQTQVAGRELSQLADGLRQMLSRFTTSNGNGHGNAPAVRPTGTPSRGEPNLSDKVPEKLRSSWSRVKDSGFLDTFYSKFVKSDPRIGKYLQNTDMVKQKKLLIKGLINAVNSASGDETARSEIAILASTHRKGKIGVTPDLYPLWEEALIGALSHHDPNWSASLESLWRSKLQPAIELIKSRYDVGVAVLN